MVPRTNWPTNSWPEPPGDVFLTADPHQLERLLAAELVQRDQQVTLAENGLAAISTAAGDVPVRRPADLAQGDWRIALAEPVCPLGRYTHAYLESLNLYDSLRQRAVWVENSRAAVTAVRARQADVALVYSSDARRAEGCRLLFRAGVFLFLSAIAARFFNVGGRPSSPGNCSPSSAQLVRPAVSARVVSWSPGITADVRSFRT